MGARKRMLDPGIWDDPGFGRLPHDAQILFICLISNADDTGRIELDPHRLRVRAFAYHPEVSAKDVSRLLRLIEHGVRSMVFYEENDRKYACFLKWHTYQSIKKPQPSILPVPPGYRYLPASAGASARYEPLSDSFPTSTEPAGNHFNSGGEPVGNQFPTRTEPGENQSDTSSGAVGKRFALIERNRISNHVENECVTAKTSLAASRRVAQKTPRSPRPPKPPNLESAYRDLEETRAHATPEWQELFKAVLVAVRWTAKLEAHQVSTAIRGNQECSDLDALLGVTNWLAELGATPADVAVFCLRWHANPWKGKAAQHKPGPRDLRDYYDQIVYPGSELNYDASGHKIVATAPDPGRRLEAAAAEPDFELTPAVFAAWIHEYGEDKARQMAEHVGLTIPVMRPARSRGAIHAN